MGGARGVVNTLSTSVSFQQSDSSTSTAFSFMQNNYYTVTCKMDEKTKEFNAMIKGPVTLLEFNSCNAVYVYQ